VERPRHPGPPPVQVVQHFPEGDEQSAEAGRKTRGKASF
jgi:hypothetical protein